MCLKCFSFFPLTWLQLSNLMEKVDVMVMTTN